MKKILPIILCLVLFIQISIVVYGAFTLDVVINGTATSGEIYNSEVVLKKVVNRDTNSLELIDENTSGYSNGVLICYASELKSNDTKGYTLLSDLSVDIKFSASISTMVRVKIQDQWNSIKFYSSGTENNQIISKPMTNVFTFSDNWYYDVLSGYAYYKNIVSTGDTSMNVLTYNDYFYPVVANTNYKETILVTLDFKIDIVQANRASEIWNVDFAEMFGGV